ncbi:MAG: PEP-CTERM sorting domain-containing protein [Hydrogenophilaceae bacterium]|nr:PEP-CTERM sorting domain-containing protein [Hydrogenophilaceae bacterium]
MKLKMIVAALAFAAAGSANADLSNSLSGNGSLFLGVIDLTGQVSATFDLGINMDSFQPGFTSYTTWNLNAANYGTAWNQFVTAAGANLANAKYLIGAMDSVGSAVGNDRYLSTSTANMAVASNQPANTSLLQWQGVDLFINASNTVGTHPTEADGAHFAVLADGNSYLANTNGGFANGKWKTSHSPFVAWGNVNTALDFYAFATSSTSGLAKASIVSYNDFAQDFYLNSTTGTLTYGTAPVAAVPEADTYALLLAGLGLVGFMARRRKVA